MTSTTVRPSKSEPQRPDRRRTAPREFEAAWRDPQRSLVDYLSAVWTRKYWIGGLTAATTMIATLYALTVPNTYASMASLLVVGNRSGANPAEIVNNMMRLGTIGASEVLSALEVVQSKVVADRVVENLGPAAIVKPYQPERADPRELEKMGPVDQVTDWMHRLQTSWFGSTASDSAMRPDVATEVFRRGLIAWADERASMIKLVYRAGDRAQARAVLEELVRVAVERYREVRAPSGSREWVEQNLVAIANEFDAAKSEYDRFLAQHSRLKFTDEIQARERALATTRSTLDGRRREKESIAKSIADFEAKLAKTDEWTVRSVKQTARLGDLLPRLIADRVLLQRDLIKLEQTYTGQSYHDRTDWKTLNEQLALINAEIDRAKQPYDQVVVEQNAEYVALDARIRGLRLQLTELEREIPELDAALQTSRDELNDLYQVAEEATRVLERYEDAKTELQRIEEAKSRYEYETQLVNLGLNSLQPVELPTLPLIKEGPNRGRIILAGIAAGLLLGLTTVLLMVRVSRTYLRTTDVQVSLGRSDVVGMPWLERSNVRRFRMARRKGWD